MSKERGGAPDTVVHVSEAFGGGVQTAILGYIANSNEFDHRLVVRKRSSHDIGMRPNVETFSIVGSLPLFIWKARRQIKEMSPNIVHLHSSYAGLLRLVLPSRQNIVYTPHSYAFCRTDVTSAERLFFRLIEILLSRRPQTIAGVSPFELHLAHRLARPNVSKRYLPNVSSAEPAEARSTSEKGRPKIVMVGRITPQKDPNFFMNTMQNVRADAEWIWVGDGDVAIRQTMRELGIHVTGWLSNADVLREVNDATLYFHSARWEGAPVTAVEAASLGTPVLVRDIPELEGLGFCSAGATAEDAGLSIDKFIADEQYRNKVIEITQESALVHSPEIQQAALKKIYGEIVKATVGASL